MKHCIVVYCNKKIWLKFLFLFGSNISSNSRSSSDASRTSINERARIICFWHGRSCGWCHWRLNPIILSHDGFCRWRNWWLVLKWFGRRCSDWHLRKCRIYHSIVTVGIRIQILRSWSTRVEFENNILFSSVWQQQTHVTVHCVPGKLKLRQKYALL